MAFWFWSWLFERKKPLVGGSAPDEPVMDHARSVPSRPVQTPTSAPRMQQLSLTAPAEVPINFGIQSAIELMRGLPIDEDPSLVLRVVRKTLQSMNVSLEEIVKSAVEREGAIASGIESDHAAIEQLQKEIAARRKNIASLEADLEETKSVKERIQEAQMSETKVGPSISPEVIAKIQAEAAAKKIELPRKPAPPVPKKPAPKSSIPDIREIDDGFSEPAPKPDDRAD